MGQDHIIGKHRNYVECCSMYLLAVDNDKKYQLPSTTVWGKIFKILWLTILGFIFNKVLNVFSNIRHAWHLHRIVIFTFQRSTKIQNYFFIYFDLYLIELFSKFIANWFNFYHIGTVKSIQHFLIKKAHTGILIKDAACSASD